MNQKAAGIRAATRIRLAAFPAPLVPLDSLVRLQALNVLRGLAEIRLWSLCVWCAYWSAKWHKSLLRIRTSQKGQIQAYRGCISIHIHGVTN